jgi:REP element-mobilizing transposase RayT
VNIPDIAPTERRFSSMSDGSVYCPFKMEAQNKKKGTWGGARAGAGRKPTGAKHDAPHRKRPALSSKHPVHVVLRARRDVPRLRTGRAYAAIRRVLVRCLGKADFRVVHLSIQKNHLHFLVEANDRRALTNGMQSLAINAARALNRELGREGKVFAFRYHATQITTTWQTRNALTYVLNNWRKHREDLENRRTMAARIDPYSSGISFTGWSIDERFAVPPGYDPLPVSPPTTWLLSTGWRRHGRIDLFATPGPLR